MSTVPSPRMVNSFKTKRLPPISASKSSISSKPESISSDNVQHYQTPEYHEGITIVVFDPDEVLGLNFLGALRFINDKVLAFSKISLCLEAIKISPQQIFLITNTIQMETITAFHQLDTIETIMIINTSSETIKGDFPKLVGVLKQQEELFRVLKEMLSMFEYLRLESFVFETEKLFLWSQLYHYELNSRKAPLKKERFFQIVREYYRDNVRIMTLIDEAEKTYRNNDAINWCCRSPFPSRFLQHALRSHNKQQLQICESVLLDLTRRFQQLPKRKSSEQFYRGMKITTELLNEFERKVGSLVSTTSLFSCTKSRTYALSLATSPNYRPDLQSVLFKIDIDSATTCFELSNKDSLMNIVFDICTAFRIVHVHRGHMSIIKLKIAVTEGKKMASYYFEQNKGKNIRSLLAELSIPPKPPTPPPPRPKPLPPIVPVRSKLSVVSVENEEENSLGEELNAQKYVEQNEIDKALISYRKIRPVTPRILNIMGQLSAERKKDYTHALECFYRALKLQEETNEDSSLTLTYIGNVHNQLEEFDKALQCHTRALMIRQTNPNPDQASIATNLIGIANVHWGQKEYAKAIEYATKALTLRENLNPKNEISIAASLAMIASIYQDFEHFKLALDYAERAVTRFEANLPSDSPVLADAIYNLATIQLHSKLYANAQHNFERVLVIYRRILPVGHDDLVAVDNDLKILSEIQKNEKRTERQDSKITLKNERPKSMSDKKNQPPLKKNKN